MFKCKNPNCSSFDVEQSEIKIIAPNLKFNLSTDEFVVNPMTVEDNCAVIYYGVCLKCGRKIEFQHLRELMEKRIGHKYCMKIPYPSDIDIYNRIIKQHVEMPKSVLIPDGCGVDNPCVLIPKDLIGYIKSALDIA
jgi:hypothetical protein